MIGTNIFSSSLIEAAYCGSSGSKDGTVIIVAQVLRAFMHILENSSATPVAHKTVFLPTPAYVLNLRHELARAAEPLCYLEWQK
jgi:hypothetical protein